MLNILKEIIHNKLALFSLMLLGVIYLLVIFAPFFAPYSYDEEDPLYSYAPPTRLHFFNKDGKIGLFIYEQKFKIDKYYRRRYYEDQTRIYPVKFFTRGFKYKIFGIWETDLHFFGVEKGKIFLLGADLKGRDIFSRILFGGRISLSIAIIGALISFSIGLIVGGISGYFGGRIDNFLMRFCEMMMLFPSFYLMIGLRGSLLKFNLTSSQIYLLIVVILSLIGWASFARVIRGMSISLRENEFVYAAKAIGLSNFKIIVRHILPHTLSYGLVAIVLSIPSYILGEAVLSLLGLGIQEPQASWGNLLSSALGIVNIRLFPWILTPGLFILITVMCLNILGDTLRDILDPKRKIL
jgi:peptide/nickel transport system permease protein